FIKDLELNSQLTNLIKQIGDVERLIGKIPLKKANPREVMQLARSLQFMENIREISFASEHEPLHVQVQALQPLTELREKITNVLIEDAPVQINKGNVIREGVHAALDELRLISRNGKDYLLKIQQQEAQNTGISSL